MTTQNNTKKELTVVTGEVTGEPLLSDELKKKRIKVPQHQSLHPGSS